MHFGVDGSIVAHDMYFKSPLDTAKNGIQFYLFLMAEVELV